ncbi:hypothetical protein GCM10023156_06430 [Novipirellula rosea]|uniref:SD-repeat containing protein B domain-containing protein n=1 Tax=Novipirellula rosea TaxID=1031540 RepID=A0ABP8MA18_9BACT
MDANGDGIQSSGEQGVEDVLVTLYQWNGSSWTYLDHEETDAGGNYSFDDLYEGEYGVAFSAPVGYGFTIQHAHYDHDIDSDAPWYTLYLEEGEDRDDVDAGLVYASCQPSGAGYYFVSTTCEPEISIDLDTDSDNDATLQRSATEDAIEEGGHGPNKDGKRIFLNSDDDDRDSIADYKTVGNPRVADENDLAKVILDIDGNVENYHTLVLHVGQGLRAWGTAERQHMLGTNKSTGTIEWNLNDPHPNTIYIEGVALGGASLRAEVWGIGHPAISVDTVHFNVEPMVYPSLEQIDGNWFEKPSTQWSGLVAADTWILDKTLEDFIKDRSSSGVPVADQGKFTTPVPDYDSDGNGSLDAAQKWDGAGSIWDSFSTKGYANGFELEANYVFDRSRGDGTHGYVQAYRGTGASIGRRLSFVGNSGVKFGNGEIEAAIIDNDAFDSMAGGLEVANFNGETVTGTPYYEEPLNKLMTGVRYGGSYDDMTDTGKVTPLNSSAYHSTHESNLARANSRIAVRAQRLAPSLFRISVSINGVLTYEEDRQMTVDRFRLQSHWGSGLDFSSLTIKSL